jgi:hypothetical protein
MLIVGKQMNHPVQSNDVIPFSINMIDYLFKIFSSSNILLCIDDSIFDLICQKINIESKEFCKMLYGWIYDNCIPNDNLAENCFALACLESKIAFPDMSNDTADNRIITAAYNSLIVKIIKKNGRPRCKNFSDQKLQAFYKDYQDTIWDKATELMLYEKKMHLIKPNDSSSGPYRYVRFPMSQQLFHKSDLDKICCFFRKEKLSSEESYGFKQFSDLCQISNTNYNVFFEFLKIKLDQHFQINNNAFAEYAFRLVFAHYQNWLISGEFDKTNPTKSIEKNQNSVPVDLLVEVNDSTCNLYVNRKPKEASNKYQSKFFIESDDYDDCWEEIDNPLMVKPVGLICKESDFQNYKSIEGCCRYSFDQNPSMCFVKFEKGIPTNLYYKLNPKKVAKLNYGLKTKEGKYYLDCLPILELNDSGVNEIEINDEKIKVSSNIINLSDYIKNSRMYIIKIPNSTPICFSVAESHIISSENITGWSYDEVTEILNCVPLKQSRFFGLNVFLM